MLIIIKKNLVFFWSSLFPFSIENPTHLVCTGFFCIIRQFLPSLGKSKNEMNKRAKTEALLPVRLERHPLSSALRKVFPEVILEILIDYTYFDICSHGQLCLKETFAPNKALQPCLLWNMLHSCPHAFRFETRFYRPCVRRQIENWVSDGYWISDPTDQETCIWLHSYFPHLFQWHEEDQQTFICIRAAPVKLTTKSQTVLDLRLRFMSWQEPLSQHESICLKYDPNHFTSRLGDLDSFLVQHGIPTLFNNTWFCGRY